MNDTIKYVQEVDVKIYNEIVPSQTQSVHESSHRDRAVQLSNEFHVKQNGVMNAALLDYISMEQSVVEMLVSRVLLSHTRIPMLEKEAMEYTTLGMQVSKIW